MEEDKQSQGLSKRAVIREELAIRNDSDATGVRFQRPKIRFHFFLYSFCFFSPKPFL